MYDDAIEIILAKSQKLNLTLLYGSKYGYLKTSNISG